MIEHVCDNIMYILGTILVSAVVVAVVYGIGYLIHDSWKKKP